MRLSSAWAFLLTGGILCAAYLATGGPHLLYELFGIGSAAAVVAGVRLNRPRPQGPWLVLALGALLMGLGDIVYFSAYSGTPPFPSLADPIYIAADLTYVLGMALLVSRSAGGRDLYSYVDALVFSFGIGILLWAAFFTDALGSGSDLQRAVSIAYPAIDLILLATLIRVLLLDGLGRRTISYVSLCGSVLLLVLADAWYVVPELTSRYVAGSWVDLGWLGSYTLLGFAALHPSARAGILKRGERIPTGRVILLGVSLVLVSIAALVQKLVLGYVDIYPFAIFGALMAIFVTVRVSGLVFALERTRLEALQSERRFRMIFERAPLGISVGRDGMMSETNPALQQLLGYTGAELAQLHYTEVTDPDETWLQLQTELDQGSRDAFAVGKGYVRKDGTTVDTHVHVALDLEDGLGISLIEDVTGRRELEDQLRQAQKMDSIGKLAGGIAHDFNNLMTAVIGYSDLLLGSGTSGEEDRARVEAIRDSALRASDLTRQLLAFSRRQILQTQDIDLRDVVTNMDTLLKRLIGENIRLRTFMGAKPVTVRADQTQLEQVVMNLAVNARDAMPDGGLLTIVVLTDGDSAVLFVTDDGVGMDLETQSRIFEPFFTTKPLVESSGLGLSTVHGIVGQSGGSVEVDSAPGQGTTFSIRLPLAQESELPDEPTNAILVD